jgi:putative MFS transporter
MNQKHLVRLLVLLGAATLFDGYDRSIVTLALPYIKDDLGASESTLGYALSIVRVGALGAGLCGMLADRFGRRSTLLLTVLGYTLATVATGLSRDIPSFVACQLVATMFLTAEVVLANVVIAEEFPAHLRATGIGVVGALGAVGSSLGAVLFPWLQATSYGWRGMYLLGAVPLVLIAVGRRQLTETARWQSIDPSRAGRLRDLLSREHRGLFFLVAALLFLALATEAPGYNFASYRATKAFGWTPGQVSVLLLSASAAGFVGWILGGRLSDVVGRHRISAVGLLIGAAGQLIFYTTPWLQLAMPIMIIGNATAMTVIFTYATELFPTHLRATARAWTGYSGVLGTTVGLFLIGAAANQLGGASTILAALAIGNVLAALLIVTLLPETRARELEAIAAGRDADDAALGRSDRIAG